MITAHRTVSHPLPEGLPTGAGLTSKPRHAHRPRVGLRGSLRPRLASTAGDPFPGATTDPDASPWPSIGAGRRAEDAARAAVRSPTASAPAASSDDAHALPVAPVVSTSSTSNTRPDAPTAANIPRIASRRAAAPRRACGPGSATRRTSGRTGRPSLGATARASASAWSYPRAASRSRESGTQAIALGAHDTSVQTWTIASANASATARHPPNFSRWIARRTGPSNPNGARAISIGSGGQSRQVGVGRGAGAPHRSHHGGDRTTSSDRHAAQNGHGPDPHPAHRLGNKASSSAASTSGR